jgi:2-polyprenyl-6-methoxyphenol hydroxylase-like FAD-dependent oxidoreductase
MDMRTIVIGGGVAGAAAALALRGIGADVTVYEAHDDPAGDVGSFVSLATNGLRGLDALGRLEQVQAAGVDVARQRMDVGEDSGTPVRLAVGARKPSTSTADGVLDRIDISAANAPALVVDGLTGIAVTNVEPRLGLVCDRLGLGRRTGSTRHRPTRQRPR